MTLEIDDDVLEKASVIAEQKGTTVEAIVLEFLGKIASGEERTAHFGDALKELLKLMDGSEGRMAPGWKFDREASHGG